MRPVVLNRGRLRGFVLLATEYNEIHGKINGIRPRAFAFKELHPSEYRRR